MSLKARQPLVDQVRDRIADELIFSGEVPVGRLLPPEAALAHRYGVSRVTVRSSIRSLQDAGLVIVRNGVGATVLPLSRTVTHGFDRLVSLETFGREAGKAVASEQVEWFEGPADPVAAERLELPPASAVTRASRVKTVDGTPAAWFVDTVPETVMPATELRSEFDGSVLDVLLARPELHVAYEDADLMPVQLEADVAQRLRVAPGSAALFVDALTYSTTGTVLEWAQFWLLPEHFRFSVRRRPQVGRRGDDR